MTQQNTININYQGFQIAVQLALYRELTLSDDEKEKAAAQAAAAPESQVEQTKTYMLQSALVAKVAAASVFRVPKTLAHERALAMGRALEQKLETDQLTLDGYLEAMKTTKDALISDFEVQAKQQLRQRICLLAIAKAEGLEATDEEYAVELERLSSGYMVTQEELVGLFATSGEDNAVREDITISKAASLMMKLAGA